MSATPTPSSRISAWKPDEPGDNLVANYKSTKQVDDKNNMRLLIHMYLLCILCGLPLQGMADNGAGDIDIESLKVVKVDKNQYVANARIAFHLTDIQQQALLHGVKLYASIDFALGRHNVWWWNSLKLLSRIRYEIKYHALSKHYILTRLDTDTHKSFSSLPAALKQMGIVEDYRLPVLPNDIQDGQHYLYLAAKVNIESTSLPLKIQSYFRNSKYYSESTGVIWALP